VEVAGVPDCGFDGVVTDAPDSNCTSAGGGGSGGDGDRGCGAVVVVALPSSPAV
jgi:hypothetical protein